MHINIFAIFFAALFGSVLLGCGDGEVFSPTQELQAYDLKKIYMHELKNPSTRSFVISGTVNNASVAGNGTTTYGIPVPATFFDTNVLAKVTTVSYRIIADGKIDSFTGTSANYFDNDYNEIAMFDNKFHFVTGAGVLPSDAKVKDAGVWVEYVDYWTNFRGNPIGTTKITYSLGEDTETSAILTLTRVEKDASGSMISNGVTRIRITTENKITYLTGTYFDSSSDMAFTYQ